MLAATDWSGGTARIGIWRTTDGGASSAGVSSWAFLGFLTASNGASGALASVAWGDPATDPGRLYSVWLGRSSAPNAPCDSGSGLYLNTWQTDQTFPLPIASHIAGTGNSPPTVTDPYATTWPSLAVDDSTTTSEGQPIVAYEKVTYTSGTCGSGATTHEIELQSRADDLTAFASDSLHGVEDAYRPDIVAIPGPLPAVAVAYLHDPAGGPATIDVATCSRADPADIGWDCSAADTVSPAAFTPLPATVQVGSATVASATAPSIARAPNGSLHVTFAGLVAGQPTIFYTYSNPARTTWSIPVALSSPATQLMPSVAIGLGGRADISYLDWRDDTHGTGVFRAFQTSFIGDANAGPPRHGSDVPLTDTTSALPSVASVKTVGLRIASQTLTDTMPAAVKRSGHGFAYWPQAGGSQGEGDIYEGDVWHGLSVPSLPTQAPGESQPVGKNVSTDLTSWLTPADPDGDPVLVSVTGGPAPGALAGSVYTPQHSYVGADSFVIHANDFYNLETTLTHRLDVVDQAPVFDPVDPVGIDEGGAPVLIPISAVDPDPADPVRYTLNPVPSQLQGHVVLVPGFVRVEIPTGYRPLAPIEVDVTATDTTTPPAHAASTILPISVTVRPHLLAPTVSLTADPPSGTVVHFRASPDWSDQAAVCITTGACSYSYHWDFGGPTRVTTVPTTTQSFPIGNQLVSVFVTVEGYAGGAVPPSAVATKAVPIAPDGRTLFQVRGAHTVRGFLSLYVRSRASLTLTLTVRGSGNTATPPKPVAVVAGSGGSYGVWKRVSIDVRKVKGRVGTLTVWSGAALAAGQPSPTAVRIRVWLNV